MLIEVVVRWRVPMRGFWTGLVLTVAVVLPISGSAQVFRFQTPPPDVSAAGAEWQISSEPIIVGGLTYYPTRGFRLFDGQVMAQTGSYDRVPVYADTTLAPYTEIYVPLGNGRMRIYERRRELEYAGTTGTNETIAPTDRLTQGIEDIDDSARAVGTSGSLLPRASGSSTAPDRDRPHRTTIITAVPHAGDTNGVWLDYNGARWFSSGPAVLFSPERFEPAGEYHGFIVYRERAGTSDQLWVASVKDGPLAPYRRR
jgi:hypothetical protein